MRCCVLVRRDGTSVATTRTVYMLYVESKRSHTHAGSHHLDEGTQNRIYSPSAKHHFHTPHTTALHTV